MIFGGTLLKIMVVKNSQQTAETRTSAFFANLKRKVIMKQKSRKYACLGTLELEAKGYVEEMEGSMAEGKKLHRRAQNKLKSSLNFACAIGECLVRAKPLLKRSKRDFLPWVENAVGISKRSGQAYMKIYRNWDKLKPHIMEDPSFSVNKALILLRDGKAGPFLSGNKKKAPSQSKVSKPLTEGEVRSIERTTKYSELFCCIRKVMTRSWNKKVRVNVLDCDNSDFLRYVGKYSKLKVKAAE